MNRQTDVNDRSTLIKGIACIEGVLINSLHSDDSVI